MISQLLWEHRGCIQAGLRRKGSFTEELISQVGLIEYGKRLVVLLA